MDFQLLWFAIANDWMVLLPILVCSVLTVAVTIERHYFYKKNSRDVVQFIHRLQRELQRGSLENSQLLSAQLGGIIGEVSEEGIRVLAEQPESFERSYDITASLATRKLEKNLPILGTIATICPYLGLFGTVVRILITFGDLSKAGGQSGAPEIMFGIGSALIATAFGLGVAILAVALNNYFQSIVNRYEDDFQLLKLLFLSFADERDPMAVAGTQERRPAQPGY
ncbi:MotA/TolQ/ExbB proton channel family protein [Vampirovibrio chlorellavorus]|uniref:MotA/TolQ/ExbB proton channel family protein n=1 Tax=Vampirovibrio chlorellavorus TaxID=758823 RepID=UPI0026EB67A4|nr:MotA/TolQ/ExbB proton channel family protein [Vampirovibrio chlorellavorus]